MHGLAQSGACVYTGMCSHTTRWTQGRTQEDKSLVLSASVSHRALPEAGRADTHTSAGTHSNQNQRRQQRRLSCS